VLCFRRRRLSTLFIQFQSSSRITRAVLQTCRQFYGGVSPTITPPHTLLQPFNPLPCPMTAINCAAWIVYAAVVEDPFIGPANVVGLVAGMFFTLSVLPACGRQVGCPLWGHKAEDGSACGCLLPAACCLLPAACCLLLHSFCRASTPCPSCCCMGCCTRTRQTASSVIPGKDLGIIYFPVFTQSMPLRCSRRNPAPHRVVWRDPPASQN
jgi:hypothetical protein